MPTAYETKMNLLALQQVDPNINEIIESATQVTLFQYSPQTSSWSRSDVEGALFVYALRNPHQRGIIILNRLSPKNYQEPITSDIEFKLNVPFLIYKNGAGNIFGAWFYVQEECEKVGSSCCKLVSYLKKRSKSNNKHNQNNKTSHESSILHKLLPPKNMTGNNKDIMSLLAKAGQGVDDNTWSTPPKSAKKPLGSNNSNNNNNNNSNSNNRRQERKSENGNGNANGGSTPGVPVVHKPIPTKALPPSVEQLFKSVQTTNNINNSNNNMNHSTPLKGGQIDIMHIVNGNGNANVVNNSHSGMASPSHSIISTTPPMNNCMAELISKLNCSAQKVIAQQKSQSPPLPCMVNAPQDPIQALVNGGTQGCVNDTNNTATLANSLTNGLNIHVGSESVISNGDKESKKLTLITPEMLEESLNTKSSPPKTLSKVELKSTLVHLLEFDDDFLSKIHSAYLESSRRKLITA